MKVERFTSRCARIVKTRRPVRLRTNELRARQRVPVSASVASETEWMEKGRRRRKKLIRLRIGIASDL